MGSGSGYYNNQPYFKARQDHGSFVPFSGLIKAQDFDNVPGGVNACSPKSRKKLVDEIELKRRSNSQQERLADYKMRQNLNRLKNSCQSSSSPAEQSSSGATGDNLSPSILGSLEHEVNWSQQSSPPRQNRQQNRKNDLSLIQEQDKQPQPRDPYASEDLLVEAQGTFFLYLR